MRISVKNNFQIGAGRRNLLVLNDRGLLKQNYKMSFLYKRDNNFSRMYLQKIQLMKIFDPKFRQRALDQLTGENNKRFFAIFNTKATLDVLLTFIESSLFA